MATIRCWGIYSTIQKAVDYITNASKTENGTLVEGKNVPPICAGTMWNIREKILDPDFDPNDPETVKGYHFQISFPADTVTADECMSIAKEWMEAITGGNYDYVLATHVDQSKRAKNPHIHAHIIVNPRNNVDNLKWNIYYKKDVAVFKDVANRICVEHGKDVLVNPSTKSKSYYEWMMESKGDSLKQIIAKTLDYAIPRVKDYDTLKQYLNKLGYTVEDGLDDYDKNSSIFSFTADISLFNGNLATDKDYFIRLPSTNDYIRVEKGRGKWLNGDRTLALDFDHEESVVVYDNIGQPKMHLEGYDLKTYFDKVEKTSQRQGLRIRPPYAKKFIRCHRIEKNEDGEGYSLDDVLSRIDNSGVFFNSPEIEDVLSNSNLDMNITLNRFYEQANIKTKWTESKYYKMSKRERFIEWKTNDIQERLRKIRQIKESAEDISILDELKDNRKHLQAELRTVTSELHKQEKYLEELHMDLLAERLEATDADVESYVRENIVPLKRSREELKDEISSLSERINKADAKINKAKNEEKKKEKVR